MRKWEQYSERIKTSCMGSASEASGLPYWQNRLFSGIMVYFLPLSMIALIPGVIMSLIEGLYFLAGFDLFAVFLVAFISLSGWIDLHVRKYLFIAVLYVAAIVLLYYLGSFGPGLIYLFGITLFSLLIFPRQIARWSVVVNTVICALFGAGICFKIINGPLGQEYNLGSWIAVSSNLILLSAVITALVPIIFKGLQNTIEEQDRLKIELTVEQRALQQTLKVVNQKNTELEQFAYVASHDLQEPLRMIDKFLSQFEKKYKHQLDEKGLRYINFATDGAKRMKGVITDLLDYSLASKKISDRRTFSMHELMEEYVAHHRELLEEKNATVLWNELPTIAADRLFIRQVIQNLVGNAVKYQKKGINSTVIISGYETKHYWQFTVADNGIGIDPAFFDKIFIVFHRLHDKTEYPGTGIGLAICKKIVENHKGKIWVESAPGQGSAFKFTLSKQ